MAPPQGTFSFPGLFGVKDGRYTVLHGVQPGRITITAAWQETLPLKSGDLVIRYGPTKITVRDCRVDDVSTRLTDSGMVSTWSILDRRWKWRFGAVTGHFNRRRKELSNSDSTNPQSVVDPVVVGVKATPKDLAEELLKSMGETGYDVSQMPNEKYPEKNWAGANPATELEALCNEFGCRVVYNPISDTVKIWKTGNGRQLPVTSTLANPEDGLNPADAPSAILFLGGETRFQTTLPLKAVGSEKDGTIKAIDDLSYKPSGGWGKQNGYDRNRSDDKKSSAAFPDLSGEERKLALKQIFLWYQIDVENSPIDLPIFPGSIHVDSRGQVFNLSKQLNQITTDSFGERTPVQGYCEGTHWIGRGVDGKVVLNSTANTDEMEIQTNFRIDERNHMVIFSAPVVKWVEADKEFVAVDDMHLNCSFSVREKTGLIQYEAAHRYGFVLQNNNQSDAAGPEVVRHNEVVMKVTSAQTTASLKGTSYTSNLVSDDIESTAKFYANQAASKYNTNVAAAAGTYNEIMLLAPDGAIQSVTWSVSDEDGATTTASYNSEPQFVVAKYKTRAAQSKAKSKTNNIGDF